MKDNRWRIWLIPGAIGILLGCFGAFAVMRGAGERAERRTAEVSATSESAAATAEFLGAPPKPSAAAPRFAIDPVIEATSQAYEASLPAAATAARRDAEATMIAIELNATAVALGNSSGSAPSVPEAPLDAPIAPLGAPPPPPGVTNDEFQALSGYAEAAVPIVALALETAERNGRVFQAAQGAPDTLCGEGAFPRTDLVSDAGVLRRFHGQLESITPPPFADLTVHRPLLDSVRLWAEALDAINASCSVEQPLEQGAQRLGAAVRLGASVVSFQQARANFHALLVEYGLQALAGVLGPL